MPVRDETKTARLEARLPAEIHALLKEAADLHGCSLSDFVIAAARAAADDAIARHHEIRLTQAEQTRFADAILSPPPVAASLRKAMKNGKRLLNPS